MCVDSFATRACVRWVACLGNKGWLNAKYFTVVVVFDFTELEKIEAWGWCEVEERVDDNVANRRFKEHTHCGRRFVAEYGKH